MILQQHYIKIGAFACFCAFLCYLNAFCWAYKELAIINEFLLHNTM